MLMTKARSFLVAAAALAVLAATALVYGIKSPAVHAAQAETAAVPASLDKLVAVKTPTPVAAVAFTGPDGARHTLAEFKGRSVLLNLWATWCGPCVKELPALARLKAALPGGKLEVVAIDLARDTPDGAGKFLKEHGAGALTAFVDTDLAMMRAFGANGLPLTILIDGQGREIARAVGPAEWDKPDAIAYFKALTAKS